jgi:septin family protein
MGDDDDDSGGTQQVITIQDVPGWGGPDSGGPSSLLPQLSAVLSFVLQQRARDLQENMAGVTGAAQAGRLQQQQLSDPRTALTRRSPLLPGCSAPARRSHPAGTCATPGAVMAHGITACLYLLPPHSVRPTDLLLMQALSQAVAVIPVIAKADALTPAELARHRAGLTQVISSQPGVASSSSSSHPALLLPLQAFVFSPSDLARVHASTSGSLLFAVMASAEHTTTDTAGSAGVMQPGQPCRVYPWGTALPFSRSHSDLAVLRQLLFGHRNHGVYDLLDDSWGRAHAFALRHRQLWWWGGGVSTSGQAAAGSSSAAPAATAATVDVQPLVSDILSSRSSTADDTSLAQLLWPGQCASSSSSAAGSSAGDALLAELQAAQARIEELEEAARAAARSHAEDAGDFTAQLHAKIAELEEAQAQASTTSAGLAACNAELKSSVRRQAKELHSLRARLQREEAEHSAALTSTQRDLEHLRA